MRSWYILIPLLKGPKNQKALKFENIRILKKTKNVEKIDIFFIKGIL